MHLKVHIQCIQTLQTMLKIQNHEPHALETYNKALHL